MTFKLDEGSREIPSMDPPFNKILDKSTEKSLIEKSIILVQARKEHCANNLLHNQSGIVSCNSSQVTFKDTTRFSINAYHAMKYLIHILQNSNSFYEVAIKATRLELIQFVKAVASDKTLLDIACELLCAK